MSRRRTTRREFLSTATSLAATSIIPARLHAQPSASRLANDPRRPQFHLLPAANWMNDPNGPIYFNGHYHMFFQYNPHAAVWGDMSWNHAVSPDMLHWTHLPLALTPTPNGPDAYGCFSGTAIAVGKRVYMVYTGTRESTPELATIRDGTNKIQESQCLAWSDDPQLLHWTKASQPVIPLPPAEMKITGFRDPSPWEQGDAYYMTVGSGIAKVGGCVLLYQSRDLRHWDYLHQLTAGTWNGIPTANPCDDGEMWECPDFFPLDGGHVLIYSTLGKVIWQSGTLNPSNVRFTPRKTGLLDLDAFYAPKTQLDARGRRILWGWIPERRPESAMREAGWSGMMSLPRIMSLDPDGTLRLRMLPELASLRAETIPQQEPQSPGAIVSTLNQASGEVLCTTSSTSDFTIRVSTSESELLRITYSAANHAFTTNGSNIPLQPTDTPSIHAFVDGSVIELILGERIGWTKRFYYEGPTAPDIKASASGVGVTMQAWKINPISPNRLTAPA